MNRHAEGWEALSPTSFRTILYLHFLRLSVPAGLFIMHDVTCKTTPQINQVVNVVSSRGLVPQEDENNRHLERPPQESATSAENAKIPEQFVKGESFK